MSAEPEPRIHRRPDGSIDIDHYAARARLLRARAATGHFRRKAE